MSTWAPLVRDPPVAFLTPELGGNVRRPADLAADTLFSLLTALMGSIVLLPMTSLCCFW